MLGIKAIVIQGSDPALCSEHNAGQKPIKMARSGLRELTDPMGMTLKDTGG